MLRRPQQSYQQCQLSNLLHWMVLHSDLTITEHHHHDRFDLFPDDGRQVPFGMGTSIVYNYLDYRVTNTSIKENAMITAINNAIYFFIMFPPLFYF